MTSPSTSATSTPSRPVADPLYDVVVVGSGFGGSVTALRLAEKGYRVLVLESGRRFADAELPATSWDVRNYFWAPRIGCRGIQRIHALPDVLILAGAGVGGGSLNYAQTLYVPPPPFFRDPQWAHITDWADELAPHYDLASTMLGVVTNPCAGLAERVMRETAEELGVAATYRKTPVGVFFGDPGVTVDDPYFGGAGPARTGCTECGNCMVGCRVGAKNTLVKNYLALAEGLGARIVADRTVTRVGLVPGTEDDPVWRVRHERTGAWVADDAQIVTARHVVLAAGTWGTQTLLHTMKAEGELPRLSEALGMLTRTNSEALLGAATIASVPNDGELARGVAITSSFHPTHDTHVENCRYGPGSNAMGVLTAIAVPGGGRLPRPLRAVIEAVKHPVAAISSAVTYRWSERTIVGLVMQNRDNSLTVSSRRRFGRWRLTSSQGHGEPNPTYLPEGHAAMRAVARTLRRLTGRATMAGGSTTEIFDIPMTAHFLGGAVIGASPDEGVIDPYHRVWGYPSLHVVDGTAVSANLGVNPALTITAQAERAMSLWPVAGGRDARPEQGASYERVEPEAPLRSAVRAFTHASAVIPVEQVTRRGLRPVDPDSVPTKQELPQAAPVVTGP
ncbi:GMC family oxidoreductase [Mobilicoccus sp.]|uniref:GMC family oxidoreductase n=1 Tax=Mobilicoccus sp. TaxID=2034349 RepID=UPI0028B1DA8B|nr:GMC family oxidoreductase [Mobilicoccus sp.]